MKNKAPWNSLEHKVHRVLKHHNIQQQHMLLAVSGGIDSMVLLECFDRLQQALRLSLTVAHVHHGPVNHGPVNDPHAHPTNYRDRVSLLVQQLCEHKKLNFITNYKINNTTENKNLCFNTTQKSAVNNQVDKNLSGPQMAHSQIVPVDNKTQAQSEEALRGFRYQCFKEFQTATNAQHNQARFNTSSGRLDGESFNLWPRPLIVLAHHQDDLIETRLIRLLRGTGAQGLKAMQVFDAPLLRPFLDVSKKQIIEYAQQRQLKWLDDPCGDNFRQWLRRVWLPSLEQKRPGSSQALGRSLQLLVEAAQPRANTVAGTSEAANSINNSTSHNGASTSTNTNTAPILTRAYLLTLSLAEQKICIARYMWQQGLRNYSAAHIDEVLKQLQRPEKNFSFVLLKRHWHVSPEHIQAQPTGIARARTQGARLRGALPVNKNRTR